MNDEPAQLYASYENYTETSASYDQTRTPIGLGIIRELIAGAGIEPLHARVLDAGCGTGNYLVALRGSVASLTGLEFNPGMLGRARQKLGQASDVSLHEGSILAMPFPDAAFDVVMLNQVIHHLDSAGETSSPAWPNLVRALAESRRVLRKAGLLVINTCTQRQIEVGCWYNALVPAAVARMCRRYVAVETLARLLSEAGFEVRESRVPQEIFGGDRYLDPSGPFDKSWRNGDSLWSLATEAELAAGLGTLRELHERGEAEAFMLERDRLRQTVGQSVTVPAWRL
jgi:ubiquinone/menaquinone biosynthesis C-methylase UbiE